MFIIWLLISTSSIGHHQVIVQEDECIQELSTMMYEISHFT
jgi:hypothetical protein